MLQFFYVLAFTIIAFLAVSNLIRNLITIGRDARRGSGLSGGNGQNPMMSNRRFSQPHPELLDEHGKPVNEPLLVMRSLSLEDAREKLDAIYKSSPGETNPTDNEELK
jgi:hypothetical protein